MTAAAASRRGPPAPTLRVNGTVIPRAAIAREAQHHPAASPGESWRAAAEALVIRELLLQEARARRLLPAPQSDGAGRRETEEEALIRGLVEAAVTVPEPTAAELRRYYAANLARFRTPDLREARHILIAARRSDPPAYAAARERAARLAAALAADPGAFAALARTHSDCSSAGEGGWLGQLAPGETTPEFEAALAALAEGETTAEPVATRYGFHIVRLERRIPGATLPFAAAAPRIRDYLAERARRIATAQFIARLVSAAAIEGIALAGAEAHRVSPPEAHAAL